MTTYGRISAVINTQTRASSRHKSTIFTVIVWVTGRTEPRKSHTEPNVLYWTVQDGYAHRYTPDEVWVIYVLL